MKITILNGDQGNESSRFTGFLKDLTDKLQEDNSVDLYRLQDMNIRYCTGCWSCWWKTPGLCAIRDDSEKILRSVISSDFLIFASPLIQGFTSSTLKKVTDRFVSLLHPYIKLINGESHHRKRYDSYPDFGLIIQREDDTDDANIKIINDIYDRIAINFHSKRRYTHFIEDNQLEEIIYETTGTERITQE